MADACPKPKKMLHSDRSMMVGLQRLRWEQRGFLSKLRYHALAGQRRRRIIFLAGLCCLALLSSLSGASVVWAQTAADMQQACAQVAAEHLTPYQIEAMGPSLGLTVDQLNQLLQCVGGEPIPTPTPLGQGEFAAPSPTPGLNMGGAGFGGSGSGFPGTQAGGMYGNGMAGSGMPGGGPPGNGMPNGMAGMPGNGMPPAGMPNSMMGGVPSAVLPGGAPFEGSALFGSSMASPVPSGVATPSSIEESFSALANPLERLKFRPTPPLKQFGYSLFASPAARFPLNNPRPNIGPGGNGQGTVGLASQGNPSALGELQGGVGGALPASGYLPSTGFLQQPSYLSLGDNFPVGPDYVLGPGDELNLLLWGRVNRSLKLVVQRDGSLMVPDVGPVDVAGLTFAEARKLLEGRLSQITGVQADVTIGRIHTIQVFILGQVKNPGHYTLSGLAHVSNALAAAGGISRLGSLRDIQVRRDNKVDEIVDLYRMLLHGDTSADIRLHDGDVIFVPVIGPVVGIAGDVKNPGIYELQGPEPLSSALALAGGVGPFGYAARVEVQRVQDHERRIVLDVDLNQVASRRFVVRDGDLITIQPVLARENNTVMLLGNVNRPGIYQWYPGMRIADLIEHGEGVAEHTFLDYALVRRQQKPTYSVRYLAVDLQAALANRGSGADFELLPHDQLRIYNDQELQTPATVTVRGAVRKPGTYSWSRGMRVSDLVFEAGGLRDDAYRERAELARTQVVGGARTRFSFIDVNLQVALSQNGDNPLLRQGDELFVQQASNYHKPGEVWIAGQVVRPGPYVIRASERLSDLLIQCGGLRPDAYLPAAVFLRTSVQQIQQQRLDESRGRLQLAMVRATLVPTQTDTNSPSTTTPKDRMMEMAQLQGMLDAAMSKQAMGRVVLHLSNVEQLESSRDNISLEDGDRITVPKRPVSVNVLGEVYSPTAIIYSPHQTVQGYLQGAGGTTQNADVEHIFVVRADGEILTDQGLRDQGKGRLFPLLPAFQGGLMDATLEPGDTVYVPEQLIYFDKLKYWTSVTQIVANTATGLGILALLATSI